MSKFVNILKSFQADESGAVSSEYAILLVLIGLALITAIGLLSGAIGGAMNRVTTCISTGVCA